jgi:hypothetical protein
MKRKLAEFLVRVANWLDSEGAPMEPFPEGKVALHPMQLANITSQLELELDELVKLGALTAYPEGFLITSLGMAMLESAEVREAGRLN